MSNQKLSDFAMLTFSDGSSIQNPGDVSVSSMGVAVETTIILQPS